MNYSEFVHSRFKDGARIIGDLNFKMTADQSNAAMDRLHAAIGMVGEVRELRDSTGRENTIEELGDFVFYLQAYANTLSDTMMDAVDQLDDASPSIEQLDIAAHKLLDLAKKEVIYCKSFDESKVSQIVGGLWYIAASYAWSELDKHIFDIMDTNRDKLEKRYPSGYSNAAAQARADKAGELVNQLVNAPRDDAKALRDLLNRRPAMNAGLVSEYAKWSGECHLVMAGFPANVPG